MTTTELIKKQIDEIKNLRSLPSAKNPVFEKWNQLTLAILERKLGKKKAEDFPSFHQFWPNRIGPWHDDELKESLLAGLASAEAYLTGIVEEVEIFGEEQAPNENVQKDSVKNQRFGSITVSGGTLILGDGNKVTQVAVKELVEALEKEIMEKVLEGEEKKGVLESLKKITTNETFASVAGALIGEVLRRVRP